ncbi:probable G-protein coupled receptor 176 [Ptychodera flava]|uniref:probable G-protein coupled receptor 176 n=1 Tax=Ptychodera flava TaxID=63121 RepID=UPI00396A7A87
MDSHLTTEFPILGEEFSRHSTTNVQNVSQATTSTALGSTVQFYDNDPVVGEYTYMYACATILSVCSLLSTIGNITVIVVVYRKPSLHTVTHLLIVNLATADLLSSVLCIPFDVAANYNGGAWLPGVVSCKVVRFLYSTFVSASIVTLSAIAIDRYYSVVYPLERKITLFKGKVMTIYIWVHAVVICMPNLFVFDVARMPGTDTDVCADVWGSQTQRGIYLVVYTTFTIFIPLVITCFAYCFVWRAFRFSQRRVNVIQILKRPRTATSTPYASKTEIKLLKMLFVMVSVFLLCWGPHVVVIFYLTFAPSIPIKQYAILTVAWVTRLNAVINPVIYAYLNKHFRQGFYDLLRTCPCKCAKTINFRVDVSAPPTDIRGYHRRDGARRSITSANRDDDQESRNIFIVSNFMETARPRESDVRKRRKESGAIQRRVTTSEVQVHTTEKQIDALESSRRRIPTARKTSLGLKGDIFITDTGKEPAKGGTLELKGNWTKGYGPRKRLLPPLGATPETLVETKKHKRKKKKKQVANETQSKSKTKENSNSGETTVTDSINS